jgi:SAM-dependent methyltransferase
MPIHCNLLWSSREGALGAPRGDLRLGFCQECGHIFNLAFSPELMEYTQAYENSLHFSSRFQSYAESLAARLIGRYDLHNKDVIDIGCGKGDFLAMLCERGQNRGVGFDPSYVPDNMDPTAAGRMTIIRDFYSARYAGYKADLISCRHVLEHIQSPHDFVENVRSAIGDRRKTAVFFEVPNVMFTLKDMGIWDLIYEHCSYFSRSSLSRLFMRSGFTICEQTELYEGQFLGIDAVQEGGQNTQPVQLKDSLAEMATAAGAFANKYREKVKVWKENLERMAAAGQRGVVWGGGSKGVTFLNTLKPGSQVMYMVDINPRKQGMFVAGTGQEIVSPEFLRERKPDFVIIMNPIYETEIQGTLDKLGIAAKVLVA